MLIRDSERQKTMIFSLLFNGILVGIWISNAFIWPPERWLWVIVCLYLAVIFFVDFIQDLILYIRQKDVDSNNEKNISDNSTK